ncbi:DNA-damage-inducible protein J [Clostridia bacterium]|nr:DNA-damage-inducible protein J [Clostridia bacterium]
MANTIDVTLTLDKKVKENAQILFEDLGLSLSTAFTVFCKQALIQGKIPFEIVDPFYGERNQEHLRKVLEAVERGEFAEHELIED